MSVFSTVDRFLRSGLSHRDGPAIGPARRIIATMLLAGGLTFGSIGAIEAQTYPSDPIKLIVPYGAGSGGDISARIIVEQIRQDTGATIVVDNRAGANAIIGTTAAAHATADGYTLVMTNTSGFAIAPATTKNLPYDPIKDFQHIGIMTKTPFMVMVRSESPYSSLQDLIKDAKQRPGSVKFSYASASTQLVGAQFARNAGIKVLAVPYKSSAESLADLYSGLLDYAIIDFSAAISLVKGGKAKGLVSLTEERSPLLPELPSLSDVGLPSMTLFGWTGLGAPAGVPKQARAWLENALKNALNNPALVTRLRGVAVDVPKVADAEKFTRDQLESWTATAKSENIEPQ